MSADCEPKDEEQADEALTVEVEPEPEPERPLAASGYGRPGKPVALQPGHVSGYGRPGK